jgi:hypothetical protein
VNRHRSTNQTARRVLSTLLVLCSAAVLGACAPQGIRKLDAIELNYYKALQKELEASEKPLVTLFQVTTTSSYDYALRETARFEGDLDAAKTVYSVREMLTAPDGSPEFIQVTRNKVVLYYLADGAIAQNAKMAAALQLVREQGARLVRLERDLIQAAKATVASEQALHNFLNQGAAANLGDVIAEVRRQLTAFNDEIKKADQANPTIQKLSEQGKAAQDAVDKASDGLQRFITIWPQLSKPQ